MGPHHEAWLAAHPKRSRRWLARMLSDGFDVHHLDSDHSNNDPANLVLIETDDHMRLHGMSVRTGAKRSASKKAIRESGKDFYERHRRGEPWSEIAANVFGTRHAASRVVGRAKTYARHSGDVWPVPISE